VVKPRGRKKKPVVDDRERGAWRTTKTWIRVLCPDLWVFSGADHDPLSVPGPTRPGSFLESTQRARAKEPPPLARSRPLAPVPPPLSLTRTRPPPRTSPPTPTPKQQSVKDMPIRQDVAPPGGFPSIRIERRLPSTGPTGVTIFAVGSAVMAYGYYRMYLMIQQRKEDQRMVDRARAAVVPVLQAEDDVRYSAALRKEAEEEEAVMRRGGREWRGPSAGASATGRWIPPPQPLGIWDVAVQ
jgi:NADH dehydrogenase (ubiquinone) 1 alpha subcomplex subunit 13